LVKEKEMIEMLEEPFKETFFEDLEDEEYLIVSIRG
jgi:hypothetical protein